MGLYDSIANLSSEAFPTIYSRLYRTCWCTNAAMLARDYDGVTFRQTVDWCFLSVLWVWFESISRYVRPKPKPCGLPVTSPARRVWKSFRHKLTGYGQAINRSLMSRMTGTISSTPSKSSLVYRLV